MKLQSASDFTFHSVFAYVKNTRAEKSEDIRLTMNLGYECRSTQRVLNVKRYSVWLLARLKFERMHFVHKTNNQRIYAAAEEIN